MKWPFPRRAPAIAPAPRRVSTHLTPAYEAKRIRELQKARAKFQTTGSES